MENTELFYFTTLDFKPRMELLEESWNHNYFYFLSRYFFELKKVDEYRFTIDNFILSWNMAWFDNKKLPSILQNWCVIENPYLDFEINPNTEIPEIVLKNIGVLSDDKDKNQTIALPFEMLEMVKNIDDFKYLCSVVQNCKEVV